MREITQARQHEGILALLWELDWLVEMGFIEEESVTSPERQCIGKLKHLTMGEAEAIAKAMHKKHKAKFNAYKCLCCEFYHVGTARSQAQAIRRAEKLSGDGADIRRAGKSSRA